MSTEPPPPPQKPSREWPAPTNVVRPASMSSSPWPTLVGAGALASAAAVAFMVLLQPKTPQPVVPMVLPAPAASSSAPAHPRMRLLEQIDSGSWRSMLVWEDTVSGALCYETRHDNAYGSTAITCLCAGLACNVAPH